MFQKGDHIRAQRRWGYWHHGVYISDDRVFQFGGRKSDKVNATIEVVSLDIFTVGDRVELVKHDTTIWYGGWVPPVLPQDQIERRCEWMLKEYIPGRYNFIGNNCEHFANWCVTGGYGESMQVRSFFAVSAPITLVTHALHAKGKISDKAYTYGLGAFTLLNLAVIFEYNRHIRRFWQDFGKRYAQYERDTFGSE